MAESYKAPVKTPYPRSNPDDGNLGNMEAPSTMPQGRVKCLGPEPGGGKIRTIEGLTPFSGKNTVG